MTTNTSSFTRSRHKAPPSYITNDEEVVKGFDPEITRRFLQFMKPYSGRIFISFLLIVVASFTIVLGPYFVQVAIDDGLAVGAWEVVQNAVLLYLLAASIQWVATFIRVQIMVRVGQSVIYDLRQELFEHLQALSLSFYSRVNTGRIIARVINDVGIARRFITWAMLATARDVFTLLGIIIAMLIMNVRLSLLTFTVLPLMIFATYLFRTRARAKYRQVRASNSWLNSVLAENINGIRVVQAFSRENFNYSYFRDTVNKYNLDRNLETAKISSAFFPSVDLLGAVAAALVVWIGGAAVLDEQMTAGVLVAFVLYTERFFGPIRMLSQRYDLFQSTMSGGERIFALMDAEVEVEDAPDAGPMPFIEGHVEFRDLWFKYNEDGESVLKNINLDVPAGSTVALVGETGAGKSTMVKLLSRFHDPVEGQMLVDDIDLTTVTQESLRSQMGIVLQEPFLFDGTVRENIAFGNLDAPDDAVVDAAKAVGAHEFITNLRNGYETEVEEGGAMLSVGQRQLISFARALLANPRILILDEATSSVDTQTEAIIQQALARLLQGRTAFVIAHRLSTIVNADKIVVMHNGEIIEAGPHEELLAQGGTYYHLYKMGFQDENA